MNNDEALAIMMMQAKIIRARQQNIVMKQVINAQYRQRSLIDRAQHIRAMQQCMPEMIYGGMNENRISNYPSQCAGNNQIEDVNIIPKKDRNENDNSSTMSSTQATEEWDTRTGQTIRKTSKQIDVNNDINNKLPSSAMGEVKGALGAPDLNKIVDEITKISDGAKALLKDPSSNVAVKDIKKKQSVDDRQKRRERALSILSQYQQNRIERFPLWRFKANGVQNPPKDQLIGGKRLFRVIVLSMIGIFIGPSHAINKRRNMSKPKESADFERTLTLFMDACGAWIAKLIRVPLASIQKDPDLDFELVEKSTSKNPLKTRFMQLKIRIKSIIQEIGNAEPPSDHILNFFVSLIENGNYFPENYLWDQELKNMEKDRFGASIGIIRKIQDDQVDQLSQISKEFSSESYWRTHKILPVEIENGQFIYYDYSRCYVFIRNFLLVRVLIARVILSPWLYGIGVIPKHKAGRIIMNYRVIATVLYELLRRKDSNLPPTTNLRHVASSNQASGNESQNLNDNAIERSGSISVPSWFQQALVRVLPSEVNEDKSTDLMVSLLTSSTRPLFESFPTIQSYFLSSDVLPAVASQLDCQWIDECSNVLDDWFHLFIQRLLIYRQSKLTKTEGSDIKSETLK